MLTADDFIKRWTRDGAAVVRFSMELVQELRIPLSQKNWLASAGLPTDADPWGLTFTAGNRLSSAAADWGLPPVEFDRFRGIGSDLSGNPVCIDERSEGTIVWLDHERGFDATMVNSSVIHLAESLLVFKELIVLPIRGGALGADDVVALSVQKHLEEELREIDPNVVDDGCFWHSVIAGLYQDFMEAQGSLG